MSARVTSADATGDGNRRMTRRAIALAFACAALCAATVQWWGRHLDFFRVRTVEIRGARLVRPSEVALRLGIDTTQSIWMSTDTLVQRAVRHPQVRTAHVRRWLPSTLIVEITENVPVAYAPSAAGMRAYDEDGRALPLDPTRTGTDLPIVSKADTGVLRLLAELRADSPEAFSQISEVRVLSGPDLRIQLLNASVLANRDVSAERFDELFSVQQDLARRGLVPTELDIRFSNQVIVRLP